MAVVFACADRTSCHNCERQSSIRVISRCLGGLPASVTVAFAATIICDLLAAVAEAATTSVSPGQSIQSAINSAQPGDTVRLLAGVHTTGGVTLNKSITLTGAEGAIMRPGTPQTGRGISIECNDCAVIGLQLEDYGIAIGAPTSSSPARVRIARNHSIRSEYHCWVEGSNWLVELNEFERCIYSGVGDSDYMRVFGRGHVIRRNWFHGTIFPDDITRNGNIAHLDAIQFFALAGDVLHDVVIEENLCEDYIQGFFLSDDTSFDSIRNITIRNNIMWGAGIPDTGGAWFGVPAWVFVVANEYGGSGIVIENNLLYLGFNYFGMRADTQASFGRNMVVGGGNQSWQRGRVYVYNSNPAANLVEQGSLVWNVDSMGQINPATNVFFDPQLADPAQPVGPDGVPFTEDDGWRPLNPAARMYGPQILPIDSDQDLLSDEDEINIYGTDPFDIDTDGDGVIDGTEVQYGTDPLDANDFPLLSLDARFHALVVIVCLPLAYFALRRARYSRPAP